MISVKSNLTRLAAGMFTALLAIGTNLGCGGEKGGAPSGIAGALTQAKVKVSSFSLTTNSNNAVNSLKPIGSTPAVPDTVQSVQGALYPTRNSESFRVVLKGAGSDMEDVAYYFNVYDKDLYVNAPPNTREVKA